MTDLFISRLILYIITIVFACVQVIVYRRIRKSESKVVFISVIIAKTIVFVSLFEIEILGLETYIFLLLWIGWQTIQYLAFVLPIKSKKYLIDFTYVVSTNVVIYFVAGFLALMIDTMIGLT